MEMTMPRIPMGERFSKNSFKWLKYFYQFHMVIWYILWMIEKFNTSINIKCEMCYHYWINFELNVKINQDMNIH